MKLLLFQPPVEDYYTTSIRNYPLGLLFIASELIDICEVEIVDLRLGERTSLKSPFDYLKEIYNDRLSPFSLFSRYQRFGLRKEKIRKIIEEKRPHIIGISALFSTYFEEAFEIARIAKEVDEKIITVFGGNHPTLFPKDVLSNDCVDYVIRGEGERPFKLLIEKLLASQPIEDIPGLCYKKADGFVIEEVYSDANTRLKLDRTLINRENYRYGKGYIAQVLTSRGCPYKCYFCGKPAVNFRFYEVDDIKRDIERLIALGYDTLDFEDDYFDLTNSHTKEILQWLSHKNLRLTAMNGVVARIDKESQNLIQRAGFQRINISLVDLSEELQREINRGQFKGFETTLKGFLETGVPLEVHFIIGLPGQSEENLLETIIYLARQKVLLGPSVYYLSPGSPSFQDYQELHGKINFKYARSSALYPASQEFDTIKLATYLRLTRFINFVKSVIDDVGKSMNISELIDHLKREEPINGTIVEVLIKEKCFISYDRGRRQFVKDIFDKNIVAVLFDRLKYIVGVKTYNVWFF